MRHDQQETPYIDAVLAYRRRGFTPFHTPGHKLGKGAPAKLRELLGDACLHVDVAMAGAVEDTRESTGLIHLAEEYAAEAWGADRCHFLVNGSTSGVHALVLALAGPGDTVIVPRNAHKSLLAALIFSGAMPISVEPEVDSAWGIPRNVSATDVKQALRSEPQAKTVFVTAPTYNGLAADLPGIAAVTHAAGVPLVVDQARGPTPVFLPGTARRRHDRRSRRLRGEHPQADQRHHPVGHPPGAERASQPVAPRRHGQDDAEHQPVGPHIRVHRRRPPTDGDARRRSVAKRHRRRRVGAGAGQRDRGAALSGPRGTRSRRGSRVRPTRLTISALDLGHSGYELETILHDQYAVAVEAADPLAVILNVTYGDSRDDLRVLVDALRDYAARHADASGRREAASR